MYDEFDEAADYVAARESFRVDDFVSTFEMIIRLLGGLMSAYELSGRSALLTKAADVADSLMPAFAWGIPMPSINMKAGFGPSAVHPISNS